MAIAPARPRLLAVGPQNVDPPTDGGKEGIFGALQALAALCDVTYAFPSSAGGTSDNGYARAGVRAVPVPWLPVENATLIAGASARLRPYKFEKYATATAVNAFGAALPRSPYDAILCFHAHMWRLGDSLRSVLALDVPVVVREHNLEYELVASYRRSMKPLARLAALPFEWMARREEHNIWRRADLVAFLSDRDFAAARATGVSGRFMLAPEGVAMPPRRLASPPGPSAFLLVLLNPKATQSVLNLRRFLLGHWSEAVSSGRLHTVELHVTGVTTAHLASLVAIDASRLQSLRVRGLGFLPVLEPTFASTLALVSPTFVGGGIRKKILEAMAHQVPVIATSLDIQTCDYFVADKNILALGDTVHFCDQVRRLQTEPELWLALSDAARSTVETHAAWPRFASALMTEIETLPPTRRH